MSRRSAPKTSVRIESDAKLHCSNTNNNNAKIYQNTFVLQIKVCKRMLRSRGSSVSIVSDYGLDDRGSIPDRGSEFFF
jgi:hypothetical protein